MKKHILLSGIWSLTLIVGGCSPNSGSEKNAATTNAAEAGTEAVRAVQRAYNTTRPQRAPVLTDVAIEINGKRAGATTVGVLKHGTVYMPSFYVIEQLDRGLGFRSVYNGHDWNINVPKSMAVDMSNIQPRLYGRDGWTTDVFINGVFVASLEQIPYRSQNQKTETFFVSPTTMIPADAVMRILSRLHVHSTWDGKTWRMYS